VRRSERWYGDVMSVKKERINAECWMLEADE